MDSLTALRLLPTLQADFAATRSAYQDLLAQEQSAHDSFALRFSAPHQALLARLKELDYLSRLQIIDSQPIYFDSYLADYYYASLPSPAFPARSATFNSIENRTTFFLFDGLSWRHFRLDYEDLPYSHALALAFVLTGSFPSLPEFDCTGAPTQTLPV